MPGVVAEVGSTANNYQILAKLAVGGMAEIFLARGVGTAGVERYVVLKRIIRDKATDTHFVQMFLEEAKLAAQLQHANIAQVYDIGRLGDSYFFTMEYVHGETVRALLQRARSLRRELPLGIVLTVIAGSAAGLQHAHDRIGIDGRPLGIVHRDVSPSNLMISYDGSVKVVDFGVAKAHNRAHETRSGAVKGKISYLSPEQCRGAALDRRSDLFSLGIVLWELLTTQRLYRRNSDFENMSAIVNEPAPSPAVHRASLPADLERLSLKLLAKRPEDRFQSADELIEAIEEVCANHKLVLSTGALGRFMKELFGQRPEPWVEMEAAEVVEGVTVSSGAFVLELSSTSDPLEAQLRSVRDLTRQLRDPASGSMPPPSEGVPIADKALRPTVSLRSPQDSAGVPLPPPPAHTSDMLATVRVQRGPAAAGGGAAASGVGAAASGVGAVPAGVGAVPSGGGAVPSGVGAGAIGAGVAAGPAVSGDQSGSYTSWQSGTAERPGTFAAAPGSGPAMLPYPVLPSSPTSSRGVNTKVVAVIAALCVGAVFVVWFAMRDSSDSEPGTAPGTDDLATGDESVRVAAATPDAAPIEAGSESGSGKGSSGGDGSDGSGSAGGGSTSEPPDKGAEHLPLVVLGTALADGRYADGLEACGRVDISPDASVLCTRLACKQHDVAQARLWIARAPKIERGVLEAECKRDGTDLRPKPVRPPGSTKVDPCKADPMSCQH